MVAAYGDDIKVFGSYNEIERENVVGDLNISLGRLLQWAAVNDIDVNLEKSFHISLCKQGYPTSDTNIYSHSGVTSAKKDCIRDFGFSNMKPLALEFTLV
ncbi:hypothetical protein Y032_0400g764 [Ancylostoma ceylanicum]|uniref:Uncharacterized protein n=1 Tax=Ancylostoma ceylanicum TaxID=53326 RepID=A0A016RR57_9BILA|nr:hypothetical protein Y032_0400g764 [Ancylostoma ceylanicum]